MKELSVLIEEYQKLSKKIHHLMEASALISWDLHTNAPKGAVAGRSEVMGTLSAEILKLAVGEEMENLLKELQQEENFSQLSPIMKAAILEEQRGFDRFKKIPKEKFYNYRMLTSKAQAVWQEAKEKDDFSLFQPYLEEIVQYNRELVEIWGYEGHPYNGLLQQYEAEMTVDQLDEVFNYMKENTKKLLEKINTSTNVPDDSMFRKSYDVEKQREMSIKILDEMGYDFNRGRMDVSAHPFTITINSGDVRLTTNFKENSFKDAFYSSIHEGGHGLYNQNFSVELQNTPLFRGASTGIHESQSRYWENVVGRSLEFWRYFGDELRKTFPENLKDATTEDIYRAINKIEPSLIRILADEVTYNLHIILRYELEKDLISGRIEVKDLPELWNNKMEEYLGLRPQNDREGVLQDIHWSGGMIGYFPTYSLGNIYAAQFSNQMKKDLPDYNKLIETGQFSTILNWLKENIHTHGKMMTPAQLVKKVTGEGINPKYFMEYLEEKYSSVYQLD